MCDKIIKLANLCIQGRIEQQTRVYSPKGISPTLIQLWVTEVTASHYS